MSNRPRHCSLLGPSRTRGTACTRRRPSRRQRVRTYWPHTRRSAHCCCYPCRKSRLGMTRSHPPRSRNGQRDNSIFPGKGETHLHRHPTSKTQDRPRTASVLLIPNRCSPGTTHSSRCSASARVCPRRRPRTCRRSRPRSPRRTRTRRAPRCRAGRFRARYRPCMCRRLSPRWRQSTCRWDTRHSCRPRTCPVHTADTTRRRWRARSRGRSRTRARRRRSGRLSHCRYTRCMSWDSPQRACRPGTRRTQRRWRRQV